MNIAIKGKWVPKLGEPATCSQCSEPVTGKRFNLEISIADAVTVTNVILCEPCILKIREHENNGQVPH